MPSKYRKYCFTFSERWSVFEAYEHMCIYCGAPVNWIDFEVDHIINESLLGEPEKLAFIISDYGLEKTFSVNSFSNWACAHHHCNRIKGDTTFNKSRALHYLLIASKKATSAERIHISTENARGANKVLAKLRIMIENGIITKQDIIDFANAIVWNADISLNNPVVICFGLLMEDAYNNIPEHAPIHPPYIYDWLEGDLVQSLTDQLGCTIKILESGRNGETISIRIGFWDLDLDKIDTIRLDIWQILEISLHTDIYGEFVQRGIN